MFDTLKIGLLSAACAVGATLIASTAARATLQEHDLGAWVLEIDPNEAEGYCALYEKRDDGFMIVKYPEGPAQFSLTMSSQAHPLADHTFILARALVPLPLPLYTSQPMQATSALDDGVGLPVFRDTEDFVRFIDAMDQAELIIIYPPTGYGAVSLPTNGFQDGFDAMLERCPFVELN